MKKRPLCFGLTLLAAIIFILSCGNSNNKALKEGEQLAHQYCASCHAFPEPDLLDKKTWEDNVLPVMAQFMKVDLYYEPYNKSGPAGDVNAERSEPKDLFPYEKWKSIVAWYVANAPATPLPRKENMSRVGTELPLFDLQLVSGAVKHPLTTYIGYDTATRRSLFGDGLKGALFALAGDSPPEKLFDLPGGIADLHKTDGGWLALTMGLLQPSDQKIGKLLMLVPGKPAEMVLDSLQRPVRFREADLDGDGRKDVVMSEFGFRYGALSWWQNNGKGYTKHVLRALPGATDIEIRDLDKNGLPDIAVMMSQGDEGIFFYYNEGSGKFREERVLQFPPAYGSNYFELLDLNGDGSEDILTTNGDNGDASNILKAYHGIRLFLNDGKQHFTEKKFLPVYGVQKALARDFDGDGDLDLASIASFPDWLNHPEESFLYWENKGDWSFTRSSFEAARDGRWMTMDANDIDGDGDLDLLLGNANFSLADVPAIVKDRWKEKSQSVIVLRNRLRR